PEARTEELALVERRETARREASPMERLPEPIPRTREVMADRPRVEARVDAAEQHGKARPHDIRDPSAVGGGELLRRRPPRCGAGHRARHLLGFILDEH